MLLRGGRQICCSRQRMLVASLLCIQPPGEGRAGSGVSGTDLLLSCVFLAGVAARHIDGSR